MLLGILLVVLAGLIYYSTHRIPPDPILKQELYVEEDEFWDDQEEADFAGEDDNTICATLSTNESLEYGPSSVKIKKSNKQRQRQREKNVDRRRKRNKIAKKSRRQNRT